MKKPRVVIFIEGGVIHDIMSDSPIEIRVVDYDIEGSDDYTTIKLPEGSEKHEVRLSKYSLKGEENLNFFFNQKGFKWNYLNL